MRMKLLYKFIFTSLLFIAIMGSNSLIAGGPPGPPGGSGGPPCWPPPCVPIDGGISFLILAGLAYGGKKAFDISKEQKG